MRLPVFLGNEFALAYGKPVKHLDYRFEMFLCPDQFQANAVQGRSHVQPDCRLALGGNLRKIPPCQQLTLFAL
jgi:hypothetical protein